MPADPITQLLTIGPIPSHRVSDAPFSVAVNGSSGNAASFQSKTEGICTVTPSGMVSLTGQLGTCTLSATVAGNAGFTSAADTTSFEITQGTQAPPQNVICTAGVGQISCVFTAPPAALGGDAAVPPLTGYTLSCAPASGQVSGLGSAVTISGATSPLVFNGLPTGILMSCTIVTNNSVGSGAASVASLVQPYSMLSRQGGIDVNGDGKGELMLRNADGSFIGRLNSMTQQLLFTPITDVGAENRILGIGDFGGRGKSDLLLQDVVSGDVQFWMGFDGFVDSRRAVRNVKPGWNVEAVADLDGDGKTDIVWRFTSTPANPSPNPDDNGVVFIWFMNDGVISEVKHRGGAPLSWSLIGAADLHGSGMADLIYVSPTMQIRSITALANREFINEAIGTVPVGYTLARLADFTGDGKSDLLFSNPQGKLTLWVMNGINIQSQIDLPPVDPSWILLAIADLNGDGTTDLVFKKPDDTLVVWLMNASAPSSPTVITNAGAAPAGAVAVEP